MAKVNFNGMEFEGTPEELAVLFAEMEKHQACDKPCQDYPEVGPAEEPLKVGDYAKITNADKLTLGGFKVGDIVELHRNRYGEYDEDYYVKTIDGCKAGYAPKKGRYIVKLTEDEVAAIKEKVEAKEAQHKLELKWAEIGRKVNEYKVGDVIGYKFSKNDETVSYVIKRIEGNELWFYCDDEKEDMYIRKESETIQFIMPVEARFDR